MDKVIVIPPFDEFNYMPCINWFDRDNYDEYSVICFDNHATLFPRYDKILTLEDSFTAALENKEKNRIINEIQEKASVKFKEFEVCRNDVFKDWSVLKTGGQKMYNFMFSKLTQEMLDGEVFFKPKENDYIEIKEKMSKLSGKIVTINGRNLDRNQGRNNCLKPLIDELLREGVTVVNCTLPSCRLDIKHENYIDASDDCVDYSKNVSYFLNSDVLISIADAGAVTSHISTATNIILYQKGGWVDSANFGFDGKSLFDAKVQVQQNAIKTSDTKGVLAALSNFEKPKNIEFFDESIIQKINLD